MINGCNGSLGHEILYPLELEYSCNMERETNILLTQWLQDYFRFHRCTTMWKERILGAAVVQVSKPVWNSRH